MSVTMSAMTPPETLLDTQFWIICREENQLTQRLVREINYWQISGVRARLGHQMSVSAEDAIARADYAIFVTLCEHPCSQAQLLPVTSTQTKAAQAAVSFLDPVSFLNRLRKRHNSAPQSWWLQLPLTEIRHQGVKYVPTEHTLSRALTQIEVFVRNYYLQPKLQQHRPPSQPASVQTEKVLQAA